MIFGFKIEAKSPLFSLSGGEGVKREDEMFSSLWASYTFATVVIDQGVVQGFSISRV